MKLLETYITAKDDYSFAYDEQEFGSACPKGQLILLCLTTDAMYDEIAKEVLKRRTNETN